MALTSRRVLFGWPSVRPAHVAMLLAGTALPALLWPRDTLAQPCERSCAAQARDAHGCCPPSSSPKPSPSPRAECRDGKTISADTAGHCCWVGQVWTAGRCVGVPTSCPDSRTSSPKTEECELAQCPAGKQRQDDGTHCCWPGQGWSVTRQTCVGTKECPRGFAPSGDECVGVPGMDRDGDGIPDERDRCPDVAEDMNSFEDADGCPDELKRAGGLAAAERQRLIEQQIEVELQESAKQGAEANRARELARVRIEENWQHEVAKVRARRVAGLVISGVGILAGIGSFVFMGLGAGENGSVQSGSLATGADIAKAASNGSTDNAVAIVLGITAIAACGTGVPLFFTALGTPAKPSFDNPVVSLSPMPKAPGVVATVHFE
jgi:hypothetical protein